MRHLTVFGAGVIVDRRGEFPGVGAGQGQVVFHIDVILATFGFGEMFVQDHVVAVFAGHSEIKDIGLTKVLWKMRSDIRILYFLEVKLLKKFQTTLNIGKGTFQEKVNFFRPNFPTICFHFCYLLSVIKCTTFQSLIDFLQINTVCIYY